jgi:hypothetical protein
MLNGVPELVASERLELSDLSSSNNWVEITTVNRSALLTEETQSL